MPSDAQIETRACPECGEEFTGPTKGAGSVGFKLGGHRNRKHGYQNPEGPRKGRKSSTTPTEVENSQPIMSIVRDGASEVGGTGAPKEKELTDALARILHVGSVGIGATLVETDDSLVTAAQQEAVMDEVVLSLSEAREMTAPLGRAFHKTSINKKYGRTIVDNTDAVSSVIAIVTYGARLGRYLRRRQQTPTRGTVEYIPPPATSPQGAGAPSDFQQWGASDPNASNGKVLTPDDVERIQRGEPL